MELKLSRARLTSFALQHVVTFLPFCMLCEGRVLPLSPQAQRRHTLGPLEPIWWHGFSSPCIYHKTQNHGSFTAAIAMLSFGPLASSGMQEILDKIIDAKKTLARHKNFILHRGPVAYSPKTNR